MSSTYARTSALRAFQDHRPVRESTAALGHAGARCGSGFRELLAEACN